MTKSLKALRTIFVLFIATAILAVCGGLFTLPTSGNPFAPQQAYAATAYDLWLGDTQVTSDNQGDILGSTDEETGKPTASYDPETGVLELHNPTIEGLHDVSKSWSAIVYSGESLKVKGQWSLEYSVDRVSVYAFYLNKSDLEFFEDDAAETSISLNLQMQNYQNGAGGIYVSGGSLTFNGGQIAINTLGESDGYAVHVGGGNLAFNAGTLTIDSSYAAVDVTGGNSKVIIGEGCGVKADCHGQGAWEAVASNRIMNNAVFGEIPPTLAYTVGVEGSTDWQGWVSDGAMAGTAGKSLRMEGLKMQVEDARYNGGIRYQVQLQSDGWQDWKQDGQLAGYNPKKSGGKRLEAMKIELTGDLAKHYDVWYHLQVQRFGWMGWAKNGEPAGTVGYSFRVEAVEAVLLPKGSKAPSVGHSVETEESNMLSFVRCRSYDSGKWQGPKGEGDVSGTRRQRKTCIRAGLSASSFSAAGIDRGDSVIQVRVYQKTWDGYWYGWSEWTDADDADAGRTYNYEIKAVQARIKPGTALDSQFDLYYRTEVSYTYQGSNWLGWAKNGESAGTRLGSVEQLQFSLVEKGGPVPTAENNAKQRWVLERWPSGTEKATVGSFPE